MKRAIRSTLRKLALLILAIALPTLTGSAHAQTGDVAAAKALHDQAQQLVKSGKYAEACPKLEAVVKMVPQAVGAKFHLAECYEAWGKLARAHGGYLLATAAAEQAGQKARAKHGKENSAALEKRVPRLTIEVPQSVRGLPGLVVNRNGAPVHAAMYGVAVPVDPGQHEIVVEATGKKPWTQKLSLAEKANERVTVPLLEAANVGPIPTAPPPPTVTAAPPPPPPPVLPEPTSSGSPVWPWVVGGAGIVLGAVGVGFAIDQRSVQADIEDKCPSETFCEAGFDAKAANERLDRDYLMFVGFGAAGLATIGVATVGLLFGGDTSAEEGATTPVWPWLVGGAGVLMGGAAIAFAVDQQSVQADIDEACQDGCPPELDAAGANSRLYRDYGLFVGLGLAGATSLGIATVALARGGNSDSNVTLTPASPDGHPGVSIGASF